MLEMHSNRLISRKEMGQLDLYSRVALEAKVTDAMCPDRSEFVLPAGWKFQDYTGQRPWRKYLFDFLGPMQGQTVLDLGCGYHPTPMYFALAGAERVVACDVSPQAVRYVERVAREHGLEERISTHCGPAEELPYQDKTFDLIHGEAVLHHLDLDAASRELWRVLRPGGRAGFKDPLGHNLLLEFARDYVPYSWKHAEKGTDCPLRFSQIKQFGRSFSHCQYRGFGLCSLLATALCGRDDSAVHRSTHMLDAGLLTGMPWLQRYCRFVVTCVQK